VIQSEAQLHAVYGRELAEAFIDNHRARVYYRPPAHRRDLAEQISKIVGQKTVKQLSFSYTDKLFAGGRSRQVSKTGQVILDADEIANLRDHETIVLVEGVRPLVGQKLRWYRDRTFKRRGINALPLPAPLLTELPDAPTDMIRRDDEACEAAGDTVEPATPAETPCSDSPEAVQQAMDAIEVPPGYPTEEELNQMAEALAEITHYADPEALAAFAALADAA
jgi:type IV secretion system protein VirD4